MSIRIFLAKLRVRKIADGATFTRALPTCGKHWVTMFAPLLSVGKGFVGFVVVTIPMAWEVCHE
jgi:hypothetical protein